MIDPVVICSFARTPMGAMQGDLAALKSTDLGAAAIRAAVDRAGVPSQAVERIYMGCVLAAGLGQSPARQAGLGGGLALSAQAVTINKMCGSGMMAAMMAHDALLAGAADIVVAGGMESMTNAPYLLAKHRSGARLGHDVVKDSMFLDGLEDAYTSGKLMGAFAEETAQALQFTRADQDLFAIRSLERAKAAIANGAFAEELIAVEVPGRGGAVLVEVDEQPGKASPEKIPMLRPAFAKDGTITAANASSISDGAAALVMTRASVAERLGLPVVARVAGQAAHAQEPSQFATAPTPAMRTALARAGWNAEQVDLWEVNEAFAVVAMIAARELNIPDERLNVNGGACALGHPIGASGARILATLLGALRSRGLRKGIASLCIGGGEATAMAIELL